jgi:hypothetical protein
VSETTCLHCKATTSNGLWLCDLCKRFASDCLTDLPVYFRNLARQRRPGRPNGSLGRGAGWDEGGSMSVTAVLGRVENDISTHARMLKDDRGIVLPEADTEVELFAALCGLLDTLLTTIGTLGWAGEFVKDVGRHARTLRAVTSESIPGWYAGTCRLPTGRDMEGNEHTCGTPTYVIPGETWLTCKGCGATTHARDHLEIVLEEAREWHAPPMRLAEAIVALLDTEQSTPRLHKRISKWGKREQITVTRATKTQQVYDLESGEMVWREVEVGPKRYRLGEVLDRVLAEAEARINADAAKAS